MDELKFSDFMNCFDETFRLIAEEMAGLNFNMAGLNFNNSSTDQIPDEKKYVIIIGITGYSKGRVIFEIGQTIAKKITEGMNGEPLNNTIDTYLYLAEFTNTFCGGAITLINNKYKFTNLLRLTPPAVFFGTKMRITTPNVQEGNVFFTNPDGYVRINIGFEEMTI